MKPQPSPRSVSVMKVLLVCATVGVGAGVVIAEVRRSPAFEMAAAPLDVISTEARSESAPAEEAQQHDDVMAPSPESLESVEPYPNASPRKLTSKSAVASMPLDVSWFSTTDSADAVLSFYEHRARSSDRLVVQHRFNEGVGYVAWASSPDQPMHMISVVQKTNETLVFISVSEPRRVFEAPRTLRSGALLPPTASAPLTVSMAELEGQRTTYALAKGATVAQTRQFYERALDQAGFDVTAGEGDVLVARRGRATQVVRLTEASDDTQILLSEVTE